MILSATLNGGYQRTGDGMTVQATARPAALSKAGQQKASYQETVMEEEGL